MHLRSVALPLFVVLLIGCGGDTPPAPSAPTAPAPPTAPATGAAPDHSGTPGGVPADHVLHAQMQALEKARDVQKISDAEKARIDAAVDEQQP